MGFFDIFRRRRIKPKRSTAGPLTEYEMEMVRKHNEEIKKAQKEKEAFYRQRADETRTVNRLRKPAGWRKYLAQYNAYKDDYKIYQSERQVKDPEAAAAAELPIPDEDGLIFKNRFEDSDAEIMKKAVTGSQVCVLGYLEGILRMPEPPEECSLDMLTEEVPSTIRIDSIVEMPRTRRHTDELRRRERELLALSEFLERQSGPPDASILFKPNKYADHPFLDVMEKINDRSLSKETRLAAIIGIVESDIIKISADCGHSYDPDDSTNIEHVRKISESLLDDMDKKNVYFNLDEFKTGGIMAPELLQYRQALAAAARNGIDPGIRVNPIYEKIQALDAKGSSSGVFGSVTFRNLIVAAGARLNWRMSSFLAPYMDDPGATEVARSSGSLMFAEKTTPRWVLADTLAMAYEIYDLSEKWVDGLPYFMMSGLSRYMKEKYPKYPEEFPLVSGREEALISAYREAGGVKCHDCEKAIPSDSTVYAIRRTYGGSTGAESYYCPECAEKLLEEMRGYEREGRVKIVYTVSDGQEPDPIAVKDQEMH